MTYTRILSLLAAYLFLALAPAQAQETSAEEQAEQTEQSEQPGQNEQTEQDSVAESDADRPDIDSQPIERAEGQAPGRFIPSEQISQDLGVSFPVDI
jgi:Ni/Co efflux regulator RcnB